MSKRLNILWINDNPITAELMVFMYARNSIRFNWWDEVHLIVWGATVKLLAEDSKIQELLKDFQSAGGEVSACLRCAEKLNKVEELETIGGIELVLMGEPLTQIIQSDMKGEEAFITL